MAEADDTELDMYLKILRRMAETSEKTRSLRDGRVLTPQGRKPVIELRRGYIDEFWG